MVFFYAYWHDIRFKHKIGGPIKVYELTQNLTNRGHEVYLFIPKIGYPERQTSAHVVSIPLLDLPILRFVSFQIFSFFGSLWLMMKKERPDIIYVRIMWSFLPMLLGKLFSIPIMLEINDSPHRAYAVIKNPFKRKIVHLIDRISFHLSDHILPVTQKIAENMHALERVPWDKLTILPSGTNTDLFHPMDKHLCCRRLGFDESLTYVGFIGTFFRHQGIDTLIDAAPSIIAEFPQVRFLLLGDGPMRERWNKKIQDNKLSTYFIFPGHVPYEKVPSYCGVMDVCVAPFLNEAEEASAVKVFDYLACGKPVIMSDIMETGKFFENSGSVVLVPSEDKASLSLLIAQLLKNDTLRAEMEASGRKFVVSKYSRVKIAETVESIATRLILEKNI